MFDLNNWVFAAAVGGAVAFGSTAAADGHLEKITVAYFLEWPMPYEFAKVNEIYEQRMGVDIEWVAFDGGTAITELMGTGEVEIGVSLGAATFVIATSNGIDIQAVDVATSYASNQNCVVASALGITKDNATQELPGLTVALPLGTATHFGFLQLMEHFNVDVSTLTTVDLTAAQASAALAQGEVDMACGWGGPLRRMLEFGNILLTGPEKEELGILVFDVTVVRRDFLEAEPEYVTEFLAVTHEMNAIWNAGQMNDAMMPIIAEDAGLPLGDAMDHIETLVFPSVSDQLSDRWLGAAVPTYFSGVADVFLEYGVIESRLDSYVGTVETEPLSAAN